VNAGIYEAYMASPHPDSINEHVYANDQHTQVRALCSKCHTDQGARLYKDVDGDGATIRAALTNEAAHTEFDAVQCRTCHEAHNPDELLESATAATATATARSAEFNTCTNCHQLLNGSDAKISPFHATHANSITTNHFDDPATAAIEGFNVSRSSSTACSNCHNPHNADLTPNEQWADSGHGDMAAAPWVESDFKTRTTCMRCHTTTAFIAFATDPVNYNAATVSFSHLSGQQKEMLYCNACHTNSAFDRRVISTVPFPSGVSLSIDTDSNICIACHQGRASKVQVESNVAGTSFTNVHYLAAGASFFGSEAHGGYEYNGKTYVTRNTFEGHGGYMDTCAKCHLRTDTADGLDHHFLPQVGDCSGCHNVTTDLETLRIDATPDYDGDGNTTESMKDEFAGLRSRLYTLIRSYASSSRGVAISYDPDRNAYWFRDPNNNGVRDSSETTNYNVFDQKLLRACYNYHLNVKEPGGFVHNARYHVQLLYDSIQDLGGDVSSLTRP
jgi:nitrate/TMAO reductase-like tetraheme cytochrome c subunit